MQLQGKKIKKIRDVSTKPTKHKHQAKFVFSIFAGSILTNFFNRELLIFFGIQIPH